MIVVQSSAYLPYDRKQQLNYIVLKGYAGEGPKDITSWTVNCPFTAGE